MRKFYLLRHQKTEFLKWTYLLFKTLIQSCFAYCALFILFQKQIIKSFFKNGLTVFNQDLSVASLTTVYLTLSGITQVSLKPIRQLHALDIYMRYNLKDSLYNMLWPFSLLLFRGCFILIEIFQVFKIFFKVMNTKSFQNKRIQ